MRLRLRMSKAVGYAIFGIGGRGEIRIGVKAYNFTGQVTTEAAMNDALLHELCVKDHYTQPQGQYMMKQDIGITSISGSFYSYGKSAEPMDGT